MLANCRRPVTIFTWFVFVIILLISLEFLYSVVKFGLTRKLIFAFLLKFVRKLRKLSKLPSWEKIIVLSRGVRTVFNFKIHLSFWKGHKKYLKKAHWACFTYHADQWALHVPWQSITQNILTLFGASMFHYFHLCTSRRFSEKNLNPLSRWQMELPKLSKHSFAWTWCGLNWFLTVIEIDLGSSGDVWSFFRVFISALICWLLLNHESANLSKFWISLND